MQGFFKDHFHKVFNWVVAHPSAVETTKVRLSVSSYDDACLKTFSHSMLHNCMLSALALAASMDVYFGPGTFDLPFLF